MHVEIGLVAWLMDPAPRGVWPKRGGSRPEPIDRERQDIDSVRYTLRYVDNLRTSTFSLF